MQPYCIKVHHAIAGVQVTASHNPKEDNGYKVFWDNGAQVCFDLFTVKLNLDSLVPKPSHVYQCCT